MITLETACKIAYQKDLRGLKYKAVKETEDSYIIDYVTEHGEGFSTQPYRISKKDGSRLPMYLPDAKYYEMYKSAKNVEVPLQYRYTGN